jgi:hypothetical protein
MLRIIRMRIHNRHVRNDKTKYKQSRSDQKNGNRDFHPVGKISLTGGQVPVKCNPGAS